MDLYDLNHRVNAQENIVGWWATGNEVSAFDFRFWFLFICSFQYSMQLNKTCHRLPHIRPLSMNIMCGNVIIRCIWLLTLHWQIQREWRSKLMFVSRWAYLMASRAQCSLRSKFRFVRIFNLQLTFTISFYYRNKDVRHFYIEIVFNTVKPFPTDYMLWARSSRIAVMFKDSIAVSRTSIWNKICRRNRTHDGSCASLRSLLQAFFDVGTSTGICWWCFSRETIAR